MLWAEACLHVNPNDLQHVSSFHEQPIDNAKDQSTITSMNAEFLSHTYDTAIVSGTVCSLYASLVGFWNDFCPELFVYLQSHKNCGANMSNFPLRFTISLLGSIQGSIRRVLPGGVVGIFHFHIRSFQFCSSRSTLDLCTKRWMIAFYSEIPQH